MQGSNVRPGRRGLNFSWRVDLQSGAVDFLGGAARPETRLGRGRRQREAEGGLFAGGALGLDTTPVRLD